MSRPRCPGNDMRFWKPEDIFFLSCPFCSEQIEFWKDEPARVCPSCNKEVPNPKIDSGCAKWCRFADECRERPTEGSAESPPRPDEGD